MLGSAVMWRVKAKSFEPQSGGDFEYGQFSENFTVDGLADGEVCIGDRHRIGTALFEVTQPRVTLLPTGDPD
jgi:MOSC domain-containing protein YiiM